MASYVDGARVPGGVLTAVLQLPSEMPNVTPSPYRSLESLSSILRLIPPETFAGHAEEVGFSLLTSEVVAAKGGKQFFVQSLHA